MLIKMKCKGHYKFAKKINNKDVMLFDNQKSNNLILDAFLNSINSGTLSSSLLNNPLNSNSLLGSAAIGVGVTEPANGDTSLVSQVLTSSNSSVVNTNVNYDSELDTLTYSKTIRIEFPPSNDDYNIGEVAVYASGSTSNTTTQPIVSRALTKLAGVPTTIPLNIGEIFVLFYTLEVTVPRSIVAVKTIKTIETTIEAAFTNEELNPRWPFSEQYRLDITNNTFIHYRTTDYTLPVYNDYPAYSGWTYVGASATSVVQNRTPLNPDTTGLRLKKRIGLNYANSTTLTGLANSNSSGGFSAPSWYFKFTPSINKSNSEVFDIEFFSKLVRD